MEPCFYVHVDASRCISYCYLLPALRPGWSFLPTSAYSYAVQNIPSLSRSAPVRYTRPEACWLPAWLGVARSGFSPNSLTFYLSLLVDSSPIEEIHGRRWSTT